MPVKSIQSRLSGAFWRRGVCLALTAAALVVSTGAGLASGRAAVAPPTSPLVQATSDASGVTLAWEAPDVQIETLAGGALRLSAPGFSSQETPGQPRLPVASVLVALPPGAAPRLDVLEAQETFLPAAAPLELAPYPAGVSLDAAGAPLAARTEPGVGDPATVRSAPARVVVWEPLGVLRGVRLARVSFYPARPVDGGLLRVSRVAARLDFGLPPGAAPVAARLADDPLLESVRQMVVNPQQVQPAARASRPAAASSAGWYVEVDQTGLTALDYADLLAAGFPVEAADPAHLHILHAGAEVAAEWDGDADDRFEAGERLLFFADPRPNRWANFDTYALVETAVAAMRLDSRPANPAGALPGRIFITQTFEQNRIYTPKCYCGSLPLGRDGERWAWLDLSLGANNPIKTQAALAEVDTTQPARLTVYLLSYTEAIQNPDHKVQIFWNATLLGEESWNGKQAKAFTYDLPAGQVLNGQNELALNLPGLNGVSREGVWLDAFSVQYALNTALAAPGAALRFTGEAVQRAYSLTLNTTTGLRAYQVTDPLHPQRLTDLQVDGNRVAFKDPDPITTQRYLVTNAAGVLKPQAVRAAQSLPGLGQAGFDGAAYLILTRPEFAAPLQELAAVRSAQLGSAYLQTLQPIYDTYTDGRPDPQAIHDYLDDAYHTWTTPPLYVVLGGDGTYDPKQYLSTSHASYLPPYLGVVDPWAGETAADNRFVTVDGDDNLPDMLIGRLPINTLAEARTLVDKILAYEGQAAGADWTRRLTLVGDDADTTANFIGYLDQIANGLIAPPYIADKLYYQPPLTPEQMHANTVQRFQDGSLLTVFFGHSSYHQWALEYFFHITDVNALANGARLPVVLEMTCFTSEFQLPDLSTLDEALLRQPGGGAIATWGMSGLGLSQGHAALSQGFVQGVSAATIPVVGKLALQGKLNLATHLPAYDYMLDTFTLLGDPALQLHVSTLPLRSIYLPVVAR